MLRAPEISAHMSKREESVQYLCVSTESRMSSMYGRCLLFVAHRSGTCRECSCVGLMRLVCDARTGVLYLGYESVRGVFFFFFFQAEDGIRDVAVTGVQTCALPI